MTHSFLSTLVTPTCYKIKTISRTNLYRSWQCKNWIDDLEQLEKFKTLHMEWHNCLDKTL